MSIRTDFKTAFAWQDKYRDELAGIAGRLNVKVASWEDDVRRNTDLMVAKMDNNWRVACRVRTSEYRSRYGDQFTVRLDRPSGAPSEMAKMRDGFGDFGIYAFAAPEPGKPRLAQWCLYNIALLREYLDNGGRWYEQRNKDESSNFAAFDVEDVVRRELGFIYSSDGLRIDGWAPPHGSCRVCGHDSWHSDAVGPVHDCCALKSSFQYRVTGGRLVTVDRCLACEASAGINHTRWGWPEH